MRGQNALKASLQPQACIFCSLGFGGKRASPLARRITGRQCRYLNSSRPPHQSAAAAAAAADDPAQQDEGTFAENQQSRDVWGNRYNQNWSSAQSSKTGGLSSRNARWGPQTNQSVDTSQSLGGEEARHRDGRQNSFARSAWSTSQKEREDWSLRHWSAQEDFGGPDHQDTRATEPRSGPDTFYNAPKTDDHHEARRQTPLPSRLNIRYHSMVSRDEPQDDVSSPFNTPKTDDHHEARRQTSFPSRLNIRFHDTVSPDESQDDVGSPFNSSWNSLRSEPKRHRDDSRQTEPRTTTGRQQQHQQRWQSASSSAYVPLGGQQPDKFVAWRYAKQPCFSCGSTDHQIKDCPRKCFNCGSTDHEARHCPQPKLRRPTQGTSAWQYSQSRVEDRRESVSSWRDQRLDNTRSALEMAPRQSSQSRVEDPREPISSRTEQRLDNTRSALELAPRQRDRREKDRRRSKIVYDDDDEFGDEHRSKANREGKKASKKENLARKAEKKAQAPPIPIDIPAFVSVTNLATLIKVRTEDLVQRMADLGYGEVAHDEVLNAENAGLIAMEYNYEAIPERDPAVHDLLPQPELDDTSLLPLRPPVVTIMGHVDHGKTTILDYLRKSSIAASEFGGITQHIGAFSVTLASGKLITFLDTPGHAAFEVMRQRGANVTDIVVLVVAADDSVKPQTVEAIKHARAAGVPIIAAINKIDKDEAAPERVKADLARHGVDVEDFGGDVQAVCLSGKTGAGIDGLEDAILTQAELLDHRAPADGLVEGWCLEATTKRAGGRVATVLVTRGTLAPGAILVAGNAWARVRVLRNEAGAVVPSAGPGLPVEVDGWKELPGAGDRVLQAPDEQRATQVVDFRNERAERARLTADMVAINEARRLEQEKRERETAAAASAEASRARGNSRTTSSSSSSSDVAETQEVETAGPTEVNFLVKADVAGSVEAVLDSLAALAHPEVVPHIVRSGVGPVSSFDVEHAAAAGAYIVCFNVAAEPGMAQMAEQRGVGLIEQNVIYRLVEEAKGKLSERLKPTTTTRVLGEAEVAQEFEIGIGGRKKMKIAGCKVRNGVVNRTAKVRVLRGERETVFDGTLSSLKNVKKDVSEMRKGTECGMSFEDWEDFRIGDKIQSYELLTEKREL
ncbi:MAG: hypothetical protein M1821_004201 [Bathelium mastoideum]|nr:MAG: hypothetical protein M1821_004201 [Bathelium mastoideum]